ncbi:SixA phosphatase family protein [Flavobacteriaceae bacterium M23B6Z8]
MKTLTLVRHAKSSWEYQVDDKDRPLNERGVRDAHLVSSHLAESPFIVDAVFSSYANRAMHTCAIFLRNLDIPFTKLTITKELYDFSGQAVFDFLRNLDDSYEKVMIFGHNHAFTHLATTMGDQYFDNLPTSVLVTINFSIDSWANIEKGTTVNIMVPKQLK